MRQGFSVFRSHTEEPSDLSKSIVFISEIIFSFSPDLLSRYAVLSYMTTKLLEVQCTTSIQKILTLNCSLFTCKINASADDFAHEGYDCSNRFLLCGPKDIGYFPMDYCGLPYTLIVIYISVCHAFLKSALPALGGEQVG